MNYSYYKLFVTTQAGAKNGEFSQISILDLSCKIDKMAFLSEFGYFPVEYLSSND